MKKQNKLALLSLSVLGVLIQANAAEITQTVDNIDWNLAMWGTPAAAPAADNDYVTATTTVRVGADGNDTTFGGDSLAVVAGSSALMKGTNGKTATINGNLILDGGTLILGPNSGANSVTFNVTQLVLQSDSVFEVNNSGLVLTINGILTGSGDMEIRDGDGSGASSGQKVLFTGINGYAGAINVIEGMDIGFGADYTFSSSLALSAGSVLTVDNDFTFGLGQLTDAVNGTVAPGTYTGASLTALGANYADGGGTIYVGIIPQTVDNIDWNAAMWGTPAAGPTAGNDYVTATTTVRVGTDGNDTTFGGGSLTVVTGSRALMKGTNGKTATINGNLILDGGTVVLGPNGASSVSFNVTQLVLQSDSVFEVNDAGRVLTINGTLTGSGDMEIRDGDGGGASSGQKVLFAGINGYAGAINVIESMDIGFGADYTFVNSLNLDSGSVLTDNERTFTFASGILSGSGTIEGAVIMKSGATLAPGNSVGTLTFGDDVTFESGSTYEVEVTADSTECDTIIVSGDLELGGATLGIGTISAGQDGCTIALVVDGGAISGTFAGLANAAQLPAPNTGFYIHYVNGEADGTNHVTITTSATPTSSGIDLRAYAAADGVYVEFVAYDVEEDGTIRLALLDAEGNVVWEGSVDVTARPRFFARFLVPGLELGGTYNFQVRDEVGKWWEANGVTVEAFAAEMVSATLAGITLTFDSLAEREYEIQWTAELGGTWQVVDTVTADSDQTSIVVDYPNPEESTGFFQIRVK